MTSKRSRDRAEMHATDMQIDPVYIRPAITDWPAFDISIMLPARGSSGSGCMCIVLPQSYTRSGLTLTREKLIEKKTQTKFLYGGNFECKIPARH